MTTLFITALCCKIPVFDALCISLIFNTKGVMEVSIYNAAFDDQVLILLFFGFKYFFCPLLYDYFGFGLLEKNSLISVPRFCLNFSSHSYSKTLANIIAIRATI